ATAKNSSITMPWGTGKRPAQCRLNLYRGAWRSTAFSREVDPGSRRENASKQKLEPGSDAIRTDRAPLPGKRSERVPGRARGIFEIADIGAEPQPNAGAYRHQHDVVGGER